MHLPDGIVPLPIALGGYGIAGSLTWVIVRRLEQAPAEYMPRAALMTAAFFVVSWIRIPVPPASVHLVLSGLMGALLGLYAWPAIVVGLFFQAVMFGHGGISSLGINALVLGLPALVAAVVFRLRLGVAPRWTPFFGFAAGVIAVGLVALNFYGIVMASLAGTFDTPLERQAIALLALAQIPLMVIEGAITAAVVAFIQRVQPSLLEVF